MARLLTWRAGKPCNGQVYYLIAMGTKWQISKTYTNGVACYTLWGGNQRFPDTGTYTSSKEAMQVAEELEGRAA